MSKRTLLITVLCGAVAATVSLLAGSGYISYIHGYEFAIEGGETGLSAQVLPLTVDGMVYVASSALLLFKILGKDAPKSVWGFLISGLVASFFVNVIHGLHHGAFGFIVNGWPAYALFASFEMLMLMAHHLPRNTVPQETMEQAPEPIAPVLEQDVPDDVPVTETDVPEVEQEATLSEEQLILAELAMGKGGRQIQFEHGIDRRRVYAVRDRHNSALSRNEELANV